jgi:RNA polymerase sigma-70 factor (ECF subfamily)
MADGDLLADEFERHRAHLRHVAYRMLGSPGEAEDAVQEAWLRLSTADAAAISNLRGWLTTVVARLSLDMLRARRARREDPVAEPVVTAVEGDAGPEEQALLADAVGVALLVVLETLTPAERLAFVLHDMFAVPFEEIAPIVDRTPAAARQLASRARRRVRGAEPEPAGADLARRRELVDAFVAASRAGDFDALVALLDPDVVLRANVAPAVSGADDVARRVIGFATFASFGRRAIVNGEAGLVVGRPGEPYAAVLAFTIAGERIAAIDVTADGARLGALRER